MYINLYSFFLINFQKNYLYYLFIGLISHTHLNIHLYLVIYYLESNIMIIIIYFYLMSKEHKYSI